MQFKYTLLWIDGIPGFITRNCCITLPVLCCFVTSTMLDLSPMSLKTKYNDVEMWGRFFMSWSPFFHKHWINNHQIEAGADALRVMGLNYTDWKQQQKYWETETVNFMAACWDNNRVRQILIHNCIINTGKSSGVEILCTNCTLAYLCSSILIKYLADTQVCVYIIHETQIPMIVCLWLVLNGPQGVLQLGSSVWIVYYSTCRFIKY